MEKICIVGAGYVGMSMAVMLSRKNSVSIVEVDTNKVRLVNTKKAPIRDEKMEKVLQSETLNLYATTNSIGEYGKASVIVIAVPTDYSEEIDAFDTSLIDRVVGEILSVNQRATIVIRSTVPVGYMDQLQKKRNYAKFIYCPEFLRESSAFMDNLNPSRLIVGVDTENVDSLSEVDSFIELMKQSIEQRDVNVMKVGFYEAEAIKLFSNAYLAMRVSFFNELDNFCIQENLNTEEIIRGVCMDKRIGMHYNNPSFGFGGYCLPKDIRQLRTCYGKNEEKLFTAVIESNALRGDYIVEHIQNKVKTGQYVGIYRLVMKKNSDNCRNSSVLGIIKKMLHLHDRDKVIVYEPSLKQEDTEWRVINDLDLFKKKADLIIANRIDSKLEDVLDKVYTRDVFGCD